MDNIRLNNNNRVLDMVLVSVFAVLIALCSWITIPMAVPFTMQTFGIFCALGVLGGKRGTLSVIIYILLGAVGLPVFSGFKGGVSALFGVTGGYIAGFVFTALGYWLITKIFGTKKYVKIIAMAAGLLLCYAFGTAWFMLVYASQTGAVGVYTALAWCVFPFIIPDLIKMGVALAVSRRVVKARVTAV